MQINADYILLEVAPIEQKMNSVDGLNSNCSSLYKVSSKEDVESLAPHLFNAKGSDFIHWYNENSWGKFWGVIINSVATFDELFKHFRRFLTIQDEQGKKLYFRFYDPRVLKIFLPTCDDKQIIEFFGPVESFIVEGDTKVEAIYFSHLNGVLKQEVVPVEIVFGEK